MKTYTQQELEEAIKKGCEEIKKIMGKESKEQLKNEIKEHRKQAQLELLDELEAKYKRECAIDAYTLLGEIAEIIGASFMWKYNPQTDFEKGHQVALEKMMKIVSDWKEAIKKIHNISVDEIIDATYTKSDRLGKKHATENLRDYLTKKREQLTSDRKAL